MRFAWIVAAVFVGFAGAARAETVTGTCLVMETSTITLTGPTDTVAQEVRREPGNRRLSIDFDAHVFQFGDTVTRFAQDERTISAMTRQGAFNGVWQLDRESGHLRGAAYLSMRSGHTTFVLVEGICTRDDGAGAF